MARAAKEGEDRKVVARNKKAFHKFFVEDRHEAGIVLVGTEVKSLRAGQVAMADSFARFRGGELFLLNLHIAPYDRAGPANHEPMRPRKLLMRKAELRRMRSRIEEKGFTLVPLSLAFVRGILKVELGLCRGKRGADRREDLRKRDAEREMRRVVKR
jgi:SsrA-binding protein